ncbi:MAG: Sip1-related alpha-galactosidase [Eubacteriales bacterium]|nr:Sip1-related alpha-galactosidase [Eubacteriales bacterium]
MIINNRKFTGEADEFGGVYYKYRADDVCETYEEKIGCGEVGERYCASFLNDPFFMHAGAFDSLSSLPYETQWMGVSHKGGGYSVMIPLVCDGYRSSFYGDEDGCLCIISECGDASVATPTLRAFYMIDGEDIGEIMHRAAVSIAQNIGTTLACDKKVPDFTDYFGWCTWNAFYEKADGKKLMGEMERFREGGFIPKFILLDDGWQSVRATTDNRGEHMLSSLYANDKFGCDLKKYSDTLKGKYGVEKFFVWHGACGYWGGVDPESAEMKKYGAHYDAAIVSKGMFRKNPKRSYSECFPYGLVDDFDAFYGDYHKSLKAQGVDGVKIDVQSIVASHGRGNSGRVGITKKMRSALEKSVNENFGGNVINCMSTTNEIIFNTQNTNMMRTSDDFFPDIPDSHFKHVYYNALNSFFIGEFTACDWDMFQSVHEFADFHAKARAISGGPVYVSDGEGEHDFEIFSRLTTSDGRTLRCPTTARPSAESMFCNFDTDNRALIIENKNKYGEVIGAFSPKTEGDVSVTVKARDGYVLHSFGKKDFVLNEDFTDTLAAKSAEIYTLMPICDSLAVFGLTDKYNSGAAILNVSGSKNRRKITLAGGGRVTLYSEKEISAIYVNGKKIIGTVETGFFDFDTGTVGKTEITVKYGGIKCYIRRLMKKES